MVQRLISSGLGMATMFVLAGCGADAPVSRGQAYDLRITHPAPNATFLHVAPRLGAAQFPDVAQIEGPRFSEYLRQRTGCVVNPGYPVTVLGDRKMPAAYVVPILCGG